MVSKNYDGIIYSDHDNFGAIGAIGAIASGLVRLMLFKRIRSVPRYSPRSMKRESKIARF